MTKVSISEPQHFTKPAHHVLHEHRCKGWQLDVKHATVPVMSQMEQKRYTCSARNRGQSQSQNLKHCCAACYLCGDKRFVGLHNQIAQRAQLLLQHTKLHLQCCCSLLLCQQQDSYAAQDILSCLPLLHCSSELISISATVDILSTGCCNNSMQNAGMSKPCMRMLKTSTFSC